MFVLKREHDNGAISSSTLSCARPGAGTTEFGHWREEMRSPACCGCLWEQAAGVSGRQSPRWSREPELTFTQQTQLDASSHRLPHAQPSQDRTGWTPLGPRAMPQQEGRSRLTLLVSSGDDSRAGRGPLRGLMFTCLSGSRSGSGPCSLGDQRSSSPPSGPRLPRV